jgi:hypothetical protein
MVSWAFDWCHHHKGYIPSRKIMDRLVGSVRRTFKDELILSVTQQLSIDTIAKLEASFAAPITATGLMQTLGYLTQDVAKFPKADIQTLYWF